MRIFTLQLCGAVAALVFVAMLSAIARYRARNLRQGVCQTTALAEYAWAAIPWLMVAVCALPAVHRIVAGHDDAREAIVSLQR